MWQLLGQGYSVISNANNIINNIDKITPEEGNEEQAALLKYYKGSAYFVRALAYDKLARRYCKAYDKATAEETLGLPCWDSRRQRKAFTLFAQGYLRLN